MCENKKYRISKWVEDCWARIFLLVERIQFTAYAKQAGGVNGRSRDEAAAMNENYKGFGEENQIKSKKGR